MESALWHKVCAKIFEWFKDSKSSDSKPDLDPENPEEEKKYRREKAILTFKTVFCWFYWLIGFIGFISFVIIIFYFNKSIRFDPKVITTPEVVPPLPAFCLQLISQSRSLYDENFSFDLHALLRENETDLSQKSEILWTKRGLTYGDLQSVHRFTTNVSISEVSTNRQFETTLNQPLLFVISIEHQNEWQSVLAHLPHKRWIPTGTEEGPLYGRNLHNPQNKTDHFPNQIKSE